MRVHAVGATKLALLTVCGPLLVVSAWPDPRTALAVLGASLSIGAIAELSRRRQRRIETLVNTSFAELRSSSQAAQTELAELRSALADHSGRLEQVVELQQAALKDIERRTEGLTRLIGRQERSRQRAIDDLYDQLIAKQELDRLIPVEQPLPPLRRWGVSPDLAVELVGRVLDGEVRSVLEVGSGSSTVLFATAIQRRPSAGRVVSIEHDPEYASATMAMLNERDLDTVAVVHTAELAPLGDSDSATPWYDLTGVELEGPFDLLFVDGPPTATGPLARLPALDRLLPVLAPGAAIVLDDGERNDEVEIARRWADHPAVKSVRQLPFARGPYEFRLF